MEVPERGRLQKKIEVFKKIVKRPEETIFRVSMAG
jgi:hypothetical protein